MKLHEAPSPNARRVHFFMGEKGIDCERVTVDIRGGENITPEYLKKNPGGRVPMLELDDGTYISETVAICRFMEAMHPTPNLFGEGAVGAALVDMWQRRVEFNLLLEVAGAFRNLSGIFSDRETCVKEWGEVCAEKAPKAVEMFDSQLATNDFLAGSNFSIADITLCVTLDFAKRVQVALPDLPNVDKWYARVQERPGVKAS